MSSISLEKINKHDVKPLKLHVENSDLPIKGKELVNELYSNIFLVAKKKSGKTVCIAKLIKECALPKFTTVIVFASTIHKDATWKAIKDMCSKLKLPFIGYTDLKEDGVNYLDTFLKSLEEEAQDKEDNSSDDEESNIPIPMFNEEEETKEEKQVVRKPKYQAPKYMVIFDDLSHELKNPSLAAFLKKNRHYNTKVVISSQYPYDLRPESRRQIDLWLIFRGQTPKKLEVLYKDMDSTLSFPLFYKMYRLATNKPYSFFYCDSNFDDYRVNFNSRFKIKEI